MFNSILMATGVIVVIFVICTGTYELWQYCHGIP